MSKIIVTTDEDLEAIIKRALDNHIVVQPAPSITPTEIINTDTLCKRLDLTEPTIIRWRKKKLIPFLQIGTAIRYEWNAVLKAIENKKAK